MRGVVGDEVVHAGEQIVREERLKAELDPKAFILIFSLSHPADDKDGEVRLEFAETRDELGASHAGHEVVGEDEIDGFGEVVVAKLLECAFGAEDGDNEVASTLENGLAGRGLDCVVVDEQDGRGHSYLAVTEDLLTSEEPTPACYGVFGWMQPGRVQGA